MIGSFFTKRVETAMIVQRYSGILFDECLQAPECGLFADVVLDIYSQLELGNMNTNEINSVLKYLFSSNGVMSSSA